MSKLIINNTTEQELNFNGWSFSEMIFNFSIKDGGETYEEIQNKFSGIDEFALVTDDEVEIPLSNYNEVTQITKVMNGYVENGQPVNMWNITCMKRQPMPEIVEPDNVEEN